jgi:hypothetical protein
LEEDEWVGPNPVGQFTFLGKIEHSLVLPDSTFCDAYAYVREGRICERNHAGEPFQTRVIGTETVVSFEPAFELLRRSVGPPEELIDKSFPIATLRAGSLRCATFGVWEVLASRADLDASTFWTAPRGAVGGAVACSRAGEPIAMPPFSSEASFQRASFWDRLEYQGQSYLIVHWLADGCSSFRVYLMRDVEAEVAEVVPIVCM